MCDGEGKPLIFLLTEGRIADYKGTATVPPALPDADILIADTGYDGDWFRTALESRLIEPCIPGRKGLRTPSITTRAGIANAT